MKRVVLAYSGGLDPSVAIPWLTDQGYEVVACAVDVGQPGDLGATMARACSLGAIEAVSVDAKKRFAEDFVLPALAMNALYQGRYPLVSALSRALISQVLVEVAKDTGATAVAHGCTGKGNDQVRFEVSLTGLDPGLEVLAPVRDWDMTRDEAIAYARDRDLPITVTESGAPVAIDGEELEPLHAIEAAGKIAGAFGRGRLDMIEDRLVGIKSREVYEAPAALLLIAAHADLEVLTLERSLAREKRRLDSTWADLVCEGLWFSPLKRAIDAFAGVTQQVVTGEVRLRLAPGSCLPVGRRSPKSLYEYELATYDEGDAFDHSDAAGFIRLWGLPAKRWARVHRDI